MTKAQTDLVTFSIKSEDSTIEDTYQVLSIKVRHAINRISYCEIELADGSPTDEDFPISDSDTFVPGVKIDVLAGYENSNTIIFSGIVTKTQLRINQAGPVLAVGCEDESVKMTVGRKNAYFRGMKDSDILSKLITDNGLEANVEATEDELKEVVQYYASDWDFMISRAELNGMVCMAMEGKVSIKHPDQISDTALALSYGTDIYEFDAELDASSQLKNIQANAWDMSNQEIISSEAQPANSDIGNLSTDTLAEVIGLETFDLQSSGALEEEQLKTWAKAQGVKSTYSKIRGIVKFQGNEKAVPGTLIELKNLGARYSGKGFVASVEHKISDGDWISTAQIGLSPEWFTEKVKIEAPPAAGLLPGIQGLQIGKVKQINDDPDGEFRVLITLPLIQSSDEGVWARLANFSATNNAGAFFYPEVDDEVVVGFLNDDPRYPVILGSLYSSGRAAPATPDEENNTKMIVSREQLKISFDEEKKSITIATPNSNQLVLSDEDQSITLSDQNGNSIKMSTDGIEINSASNMSIKASESVTIDGTSGITYTASGGEISMSALNISCSADVEFSASASASTSLSSSGELSINGAMVMIN